MIPKMEIKSQISKTCLSLMYGSVQVTVAQGIRDISQKRIEA